LISYWIFNVKDDENKKFSRKGIEIYEHKMQDMFWGLKGSAKGGKRVANISKLKRGDEVVFYLAGNGGQCFLGTCVLDSSFRELNLDEIRQLVHEEYLDWRQGVFITDIDRWTNPLSVERLRGKVSIVPRHENYGSFFQGSVKRVGKEDYEAIMREHACEG
jgi:hypothetical protein